MLAKVTLERYTEPTTPPALTSDSQATKFTLSDLPAVLQVCMAVHKYVLQHDGYPDQVAVSSANYLEYQQAVCPGWPPCYIVGSHLVWLVEDSHLDQETLICYQQKQESWQGMTEEEQRECEWML